MTYGGWGPEDDHYGWDSYDSDRQRESYDGRPRTSGWTVTGYALLAVFVVAILGTVAFLVLKGGGDDGGAPTAGPAPSASVSSSASSTTESPDRVTVTERATPTSSSGDGSGYAGKNYQESSQNYPSGADRQGWVADSAARCNSSDSAVIIGETADAQYSICVNPDNNRYYYRGSAGGQSVEIDDPSVSGGTATVVNRQTVYHLSSNSLRITDNGNEIYDEPTVQFWSR